MPPDISSIDIATHSQLSPTQSQHSKLPRSSSFAMSMTRSAVTSRRTNTMSFVPPQFQAIPEIVPLAKATTTISFSPPRSTSPPPSYTAGRRPSDSPSLSDSEYVLLATSARSRESPPSRYEPSPQAQLQTTETSIRTEWRIKFAFEQFGQGSSVITTIIGMVMGVSGLIVVSALTKTCLLGARESIFANDPHSTSFPRTCAERVCPCCGPHRSILPRQTAFSGEDA